MAHEIFVGRGDGVGGCGMHGGEFKALAFAVQTPEGLWQFRTGDLNTYLSGVLIRYLIK